MASPQLALAQSPPPKSHAVSVARRYPHCWSNLPLDLMKLVFERLGFSDFERAKSVCSSWLSGSRQSKPNNKIPWMILFPYEKNYCLLFNPEDKEKLYKTQQLGDDFAESNCLATYRSWLLMSPGYQTKGSLYILDLLTRERINLPTTSLLHSPILWIDEKTKNYIVIGVANSELVSFKKGDNSWRQIPAQLSSLSPKDNRISFYARNMVYNDHKLYCLILDDLHIFDFSGEFPLQVSRVSVRGCVKVQKVQRMRLPNIPWEVQQVRRRNNVVVTLGGDVLIVRSKSPFMSETWNFRIFKMDSSKGNINWVEIVSLGDEAILLDLGITVLAKDVEGVTSNSIYFNGDETDYCGDTEIFVFNFDTKKIEQLPEFVSSSVSFSTARWFLPSFRND